MASYETVEQLGIVLALIRRVGQIGQLLNDGGVTFEADALKSSAWRADAHHGLIVLLFKLILKSLMLVTALTTLTKQSGSHLAEPVLNVSRTMRALTLHSEVISQRCMH